MKKVVSIIALTLVVLTSTYAQSASFFESPLKIHLHLTDDIPVLQWESLEEVNTSYFLIEKEITNGFEIIGTIKASGSTNGSNQYEYEDFSADSSFPSNYRITLVWMDGSRKSWTLNQDFTAGK